MITLLLSLLLPLAPLAQATEWNDVLGDLQARNHGDPVSCTEQNKALCKDPLKELCSQITPAVAGEYEALRKQIRASVADSPQGDKLDEGYKTVLALQKTVDETFKKYDVTFRTIMGAIDSDPFAHLSSEQKAANKRKTDRVDALSKKLTSQSINLFKKQQEQVQRLGEVENKILSHFGKNKTDLKNAVSDIKKSLIANVKSSAAFKLPTTAQIVSPTQDEIEKKINSVTIEFASDRATKQLSEEDKASSYQFTKSNEAYFASCGTDGLGVNAFYDPLENILHICPGFLLKSFGPPEGDLKSLSMAIGHELGHSFDANANVEIDPSRTPGLNATTVGTKGAYIKFMACVKEHFMSNPSEKFKTLPDYLAQLKIGIPKLKAELLRLQRLPHPDLTLIATYKRELLSFQSDLKENQELYKNLLHGQRNPKDLVLMEQGELEADFQASVILQDQIKKLPEEKRSNYLRSNLKMFCSTSPERKKIGKIVLGDLQTDGMHPPNTFRVENFFRNKGIRAALGCAPLTSGDRPWCGLNGAEH